MAGENLEEVWMGEPKVCEEVLLCQTDRIHVPKEKNANAY
jgi:hypothetical protein